MKKPLISKVSDYLEKLYGVYGSNVKSFECELNEDNEVEVTIIYTDRPYSFFTIKDERELRRLKYEDKRDLERGYRV